MDIETGVVLAAGEGTRLRPMTHNRPKPMLPAANRPILEHVLDALVHAGV
ncbi:MAG: sugar phosphate nucleotidyltransferase, partial [Halobacteriales archaeon]|nr:sugar phosphate nucleotidyltransferase [Halobacteriales archaeon]